jgi:hypothetical protein
MAARFPSSAAACAACASLAVRIAASRLIREFQVNFSAGSSIHGIILSA